MRYLQYYLNSGDSLAQLLRFTTVAVTISLIDIGGVYLLPWYFSINIYAARIISLSTANGTGYMLNRYFTFNALDKAPFFKQMFKHLGVHLVGGLLNFTLFSIIILNRGDHAENSIIWLLYPAIALMVGGLVGMSFNFCCCKLFVYHQHSQSFEEFS